MEPNSQLGNYTLEQRLGSGATADVFMATQLSVERSVAIKVMHSHLAHSHDFAARFQREARAMGQLQHPHIARVIDFDATGEHPYMVIEYLPGGSLREYLDEQQGPLTPAEAVAIALQLADALQYAHSMGMVHRDIKPANVMFVDEARRHAVLTDFGIARLADDSMTATGVVLGTPAYIAPEQVRGERAEAAADQYGLGVMLYEMITGEHPFHADSAHALMMQHLTEPVPSACIRNSLVPAALGEVIQRSMAKAPEERYADVGHLRQALDHAMAADVDTVTGSVETVVESQPHRRVANPTVAVTQVEASNDAVRPPGQLVAAAVASILLIAGAVFGATQLIGGDGSTDTIVAPSQDQIPATDDPPSTEGGESPLPATDANATVVQSTPDASPTITSVVPPATVPSFDTENLPPLFVTSATIIGDRLVVGFDRARQPSAGTSYVAWLDGVVGPVGEIVIDQNGQARLETAIPDVATMRSFSVSEEPAGSNASVPSGPIILSAGIDDAARDAMAISIGALDAAERELGIAREHDLLMRGESEAGNFAEVRRHAEHVANIMDGVEGATFGDLDGSGLAENPGDDVGVRGHLQNVSAAVAELFPGTDLAALRAQATDQVGGVVREYLRVLAADSIGEISIDAGAAQIEATAGSLAQSRALLQRHFAIDLVSDTPLSAADSVGAGIVWLVPSGNDIVIRSGRGGFLVAADEQNDIVLFAQIGDGLDAATLGELDELDTATIPVTSDQLAQLAQLIVARDTADSSEAVSQVIARIHPPDQALAAVEAMRGTDGSLAKLDAQAQLVIDHIELMQREIDGGTLSELRRHAEHVVNLVEGAGGEHFGDLDGDGVAQNPGDDIGVLGHLDDISAAVQALPVDTDEHVFYMTIWLNAIQTNSAHALAIADQALRVNSTDSPAEAQPFVAAAFASGVSMLDGTDVDENGVIDMFAGEFGTRSLDVQAPTLVLARLVPED